MLNKTINKEKGLPGNSGFRRLALAAIGLGYKRVLMLACILLAVPAYLRAQGSYNLTTRNGLPTNYVYKTITDKWGYLWMATEKGVVKYNGYNFKLFNYASGLQDEDIYGLVRDSMERIWLYNFTGRTGYIRNDKYQRPKNANNFLFFRLSQITPYKDGIVFFWEGYTYAVVQDSIFQLSSKNNVSIANLHGSLFAVTPAGTKEYTLDNYQFRLKKTCSVPTDLGALAIALKSHLFFQSKYADHIGVLDTRACAMQKLYLTNEKHKVDTLLYMARTEGDKIVAFARKNLYEIDDNLHVTRLSIDSLTGRASELIPTDILEDSVWGSCLSTQYNGLFIAYPSSGLLEPYDGFDLKNSVPISVIGDTVAYWWNRLKLTLTQVSASGKIQVAKVRLSNVISVLPYDQKRSMLISPQGYYWLDNKSLELRQAVQKLQHPAAPVLNINLFQVMSSDALMVDSLKGYTIAGNFQRMDFTADHSLLKLQTLDSEVYHHMFYDTVSGTIVTHGHRNILLYNTRTHRKLKIPLPYLEQFGLRDVKRMFYDRRHYNVFIQDHNALYMYDIKNHSLKNTHRNFNLADSRVIVQGNKVMIAARFGIAVSTILGSGRLSYPLLYQNIKEQHYTTINSFVALDNTLYLSTDRQPYTLNLDSAMPGNMEYKYRLMGNYRDSIFRILPGDTINTIQLNDRIQFDIINAYGSGPLSFSYSVGSGNTTRYDMAANEMVLSSFRPGKYYRVLLNISDANWNSDPIPIYFYVQPYWWQTSTGKQVIWIGSATILLGLLLSVFLVTRSIITRNNQKRHRMLDLEVRSVYSQINPHFIFNSLNAALSFIELNRNEDAHRHISRFSGLLRGFLKSYRNRYITMEDEIRNLRNYIELQQTRFNALFKYEITIDSTLNIHNTRIPSLLLQPLVENAINHGLLPKEENGYLKISFGPGHNKNELLCIIEDNGIGREQSRKLHEQQETPRTSYGQVLITDLIDIFNRYEKMKIDIRYIDKQEPESGLIVELVFKNID